MYASVVVGDDEKNGSLWCSPSAKTSRPTSSACLAMVTMSLMRSASDGVCPVVGSVVMSLTLKIPNCMTAPSPPGLGASRLLTRTTTQASEVFQNLRRLAAAPVTPDPSVRCVRLWSSAVIDASDPGGQHVQILIKIMVTSIAGGLTYFLTNSTKQPEIWQLTMSVFVAGVVLVV